MKNLVFLLIFGVAGAQTNSYCDVYVSQVKNESIVEEIYNCSGMFFLKLKYAETKDIVVKKQTDGSYEIGNFETLINQKYLSIEKFKNQKYFLIPSKKKKNEVVLEIIKGNQKKFCTYVKIRKKVAKGFLQAG